MLRVGLLMFGKEIPMSQEHLANQFNSRFNFIHFRIEATFHISCIYRQVDHIDGQCDTQRFNEISVKNPYHSIKKGKVIRKIKWVIRAGVFTDLPNPLFLLT